MNTYTTPQLLLMFIAAAVMGAAWLVARHFDDDNERPAT